MHPSARQMFLERGRGRAVGHISLALAKHGRSRLVAATRLATRTCRAREGDDALTVRFALSITRHEWRTVVPVDNPHETETLRSEPRGDRTHDPRLKRPVLYQLS